MVKTHSEGKQFEPLAGERGWHKTLHWRPRAHTIHHPARKASISATSLRFCRLHLIRGCLAQIWSMGRYQPSAGWRGTLPTANLQGRRLQNLWDLRASQAGSSPQGIRLQRDGEDAQGPPIALAVHRPPRSCSVPQRGRLSKGRGHLTRGWHALSLLSLQDEQNRQ